MKKKSVEYDEIRCNKLILGDGEKGYIILSIDDETGHPALAMSQENASGTILLSLKDGIPSLSLLNKGTNEQRGLVELKLNDNGFPILNFLRLGNDNEDLSEISLGLNDDGQPRLYLSNKSGSVPNFIDIGVDNDGSVYLLITNRETKGGNIIIRANKDGVGIMMSTEDRRRQIGGGSWGVVLATDSEESILGFEGEEHIKMGRQKEEENSEV